MTTLAGPESRTHHWDLNLKVNGTRAPLDVMLDLLDCTIENSLHLPDTCAIRLHDALFRWLDADLFREGNKLVVEIGPEGGRLSTLFTGEVTALEMDLAANGSPSVVVRGMDRSHRLHRGTQQRAFSQMKDSDIANQIGREVGMQVISDATSQVHDWIFQYNQTNWEFLTERAAANGFRLYTTGGDTLHFQKVEEGAISGEVEVTWGKDLRSFRPRTSASPQVHEVIVRGWDAQEKRPIVGKATRAMGLPEVGAKKGVAAGDTFGKAQAVVVDQPVLSQGEADDLARSLMDDIGGNYLEAEGLCFGRPDVVPGVSVHIPNIGKRFSGHYLVTAATHMYTPAEGFTTTFSATGKRPNTLLSLLEGQGSNQGAYGAPPGNIVVAIVTDLKDPKNLGRVKVKYPWLADDTSSFWVRQAMPMAGSGRGFCFLPEVDDEVLVAFEHGDIRRPYLIGALWNGKDLPVEANNVAVKDGKVVRRTIKTRIGHTILLDDTDGKGEMSLTTKGKHHVVLDDKNKNITAKTTSGHTVLLDDSNDQIVVVDKTGGNKITIKTSDNSMKLECRGNFTVDAMGKVAITGKQGVEIDTPAQIKVKGTAGVDVQTSAQLSLQGTQASLKGSAQTEIKGGIVMIN